MVITLSKQKLPTSQTPIDFLFSQLHGMYGNQFLDKFRSGHVINGLDTGIENAKQLWGDKLHERGFTLKDAKAGLAACEVKHKTYPPTQPEFFDLCRPSVDPLVAYYEAVEGLNSRDRGEVGTWTHPAIYFACIRVSAWDMKTQTYSQVRTRWENALSDELKKTSWPEIKAPEVPKLALSYDGMDRDAANNFIEQASETIKTPGKKIDHKRWAKKLVARNDAGDKTVDGYALKCAIEALKQGDV